MGNAFFRVSKTGLINISYNIGKIRVVCSTGVKIPLELWNKNKARLNKKQSVFPIDEVNAFLNDLENFVNAEAIKLKIAGKLEPNLLHQIIKAKINPQKSNELNFYGFCEKYLSDIETGKRLTSKGTRFEKGTIKGIKSKIEIFRDFDSKLSFENINIFFYKKFINWLTESKNMMPNSIGTVIKDLKIILNLASADGYLVDVSYHKFKVSKEIGTAGIALNEDELKLFRSVKLVGYLDNARNIFLLGCETGLRFGDYSILNIEAKKNQDLHVIQKKTKAKVIIPISKEISRLLSLELRVISNQKLNEYIKEVAKMVLKDSVLVSFVKGGKHFQENIEKWKLISSHVARRTFATLAYKRNVPTLAIMAITGHKTEKSFMTYIKVSNQEQADIFRKYTN